MFFILPPDEMRNHGIRSRGVSLATERTRGLLFHSDLNNSATAQKEAPMADQAAACGALWRLRSSDTRARTTIVPAPRRGVFLLRCFPCASQRHFLGSRNVHDQAGRTKMPKIKTDDNSDIYVEVEGPENAPVLMLSNSLGTNLHMWDDQKHSGNTV
jgi:hypothetical protein